MARPIGTLGTIPTLTIGGHTFADLTTLIYLACRSTSGGSRWQSLQYQADKSTYQVTSGKTFELRAITLMQQSSTQVLGSIGYGDVASNDLNSAPTGATYLIGDGSIGQLAAGTLHGEALSYGLNVEIPATKYPFIFRDQNGLGCLAYGYEV